MWKKSILTINSSIKQAIENLNNSSSKIILVVNLKGKFVGTITDGDIRRGLLKKFTLKDNIKKIINVKPKSVSSKFKKDEVIRIMKKMKIQQIPVINNKNQIVGLHILEEISTPISGNNLMVIMAGGKGKRLLPHTKKISKTMLDVAGKPILLRIIEKAKAEGFKNFIIAINHLGETIEKYFQNGKNFQVNIQYIKESNPLGTAGALSLLKKKPIDDFVLTNGDILVDLNYSEFLNFHRKLNSYATMAIKEHQIENPFGVIEVSGVKIKNITEKPIYESYVNAGVYALSPRVLKFLKKNEFCNMTSLFERIKNKKRFVAAYPLYENWMDVGYPADLDRANKRKK